VAEHLVAQRTWSQPAPLPQGELCGWEFAYAGPKLGGQQAQQNQANTGNPQTSTSSASPQPANSLFQADLAKPR
jgi:hypothetical protein